MFLESDADNSLGLNVFFDKIHFFIAKECNVLLAGNWRRGETRKYTGRTTKTLFESIKLLEVLIPRLWFLIQPNYVAVSLTTV